MRLDGKAVLGIVVTVLLLWWALAGVDVAELIAEIRRGDLLLLGAAVAVATFGFVIRALRWRVLLEPLQPGVSFDSRFSAVCIGFMANNVLPARVGEFARAWALSRVEPVSASGAFGTLVVERALDGLILLVLLLVALNWPTFPADAGVDGVVRAASILVSVILGGVVVLLLFPRPWVRLAEGISRLLPESPGRLLVDALHAFLDALEVLRRPALLAQALLWTVGLWVWNGFSFWLGMRAFDIGLDYVAALFTQGVVGFGVALPSAPGFVGTFHAAAELALSGVYGVAEPRALAFAFGYHFGGWVPITLLGLAYAWRMGLSFREVGESEERVEAVVEAEHGAEEARVPAPAKVNLLLRVLGRDPVSGFHDLETVFQGLEVADVVHVRVEHGAGVGIELTVEGAGQGPPPDLGPPESNLVTRAARDFLSESGLRVRLHLVLTKCLPAGAGLGGGSSDAAATLRALDALFPGTVDPGRLQTLAAGLGSDVPFFLGRSPTALAWGRGERLRDLPPLPPRPVVLVVPPVHVATGPAYAALARSREADGAGEGARREEELREVEVLSWPGVARHAANDFEAVVPPGEPEVARALEDLRASGPRVALLAGSGGAVFGVFDTEKAASRAGAELEAAGHRVMVTRTLESWPPVETPDTRS